MNSRSPQGLGQRIPNGLSGLCFGYVGEDGRWHSRGARRATTVVLPSAILAEVEIASTSRSPYVSTHPISSASRLGVGSNVMRSER